MLDITLRYEGLLADENAIDFYDASRALVGFHRSLALVTHLVLHGEIVTQATSLKDAQILTHAPDEGSWKVVASIVGSAFLIGSVGKDSPVGQVVTSVYDYVLYETMGFHVDYDKTLQRQYHEHFREKGITEEKLCSLMEKTEASIADIHRPIVASKTASSAEICEGVRRKRQLGPEMSALTYDYIVQNIRSDVSEQVVGRVASYNMNTFKGRIFVMDEARPIPFELTEAARKPRIIGQITRSLRVNARKVGDPRATIVVTGYRIESRAGRLKSLQVTAARAADPLEQEPD